jgi:hypothetical protein
MGCFFKIDFFFIFHASSISHLCAKVKRFYIVSKRFSNIINIYSPLCRIRAPWQNHKYELKYGSSFSCAFVSALSLTYLQKEATDLVGVLSCFSRDYQPYEFNNINGSPRFPKFKIQKEIAFPFNKEMHSVVRYAENIPFELVDVYDIKQSFLVNRSTQELLDDSTVPEYWIKNIQDIDCDSFDTIILGCVYELFKLLGNDLLLRRLLEKALKHEKNIYSFEEIRHLVDVKKYEEKIFFPEVSQENVPHNRGGRLFRTAIPIVGVYGTRSQQGKFTMQLLLRREFQKIGCRVGQIGTEPSALLFGMDHVFPMGYNSSIHVDEKAKILYANELLRLTCKNNPDIVLVGSQMGTISSSFGNLRHYCDQTYAFLQAIKPDYAIVMLSITDSDRYIHRTINFLDSFTETKILSFVLFPMRAYIEDGNSIPQNKRVTEKDYLAFKMHIEETFKIPLYFLDRENLSVELMRTLLEELEKNNT